MTKFYGLYQFLLDGMASQAFKDLRDVVVNWFSCVSEKHLKAFSIYQKLKMVHSFSE